MMTKNACARGVLILLAGTALAAAPLPACPDPVFRVLLANGVPDRYVVLIFHRDAITGDARRALDVFQRRGEERIPANILVRTIDLNERPDERMLEIWKQQKAGQLPWMVVLFPPHYGVPEPALSCPLSTAAVSEMLDSPFRRQLAQCILADDAGVWVLLECGDTQKDDEAERLLSNTLKALDSSLVLDGEIDNFTKRLNIEYTMHPSQGKYDDFEIRFSMMRLPRTNRAERLPVKSLESIWMEHDLEKADEPALFLIFARGNVRPPLVGKTLSAERIEAESRFIISSCSCVTDPREYGCNLLMTVDWRVAAGEEALSQEAVTPAALSGFTASPGEVPKQADDAHARQPEKGTLFRNIVALAVAAALLTAIISIVLTRRRPHA